MTCRAALASGSSAARRTARSFTSPSCPGSVAQQPAQPPAPGGACLLGDGRLRGQPVETVEAAVPHVQFRDPAGLPDPAGVGDVLVAERLRPADLDETGGRHPTAG